MLKFAKVAANTALVAEIRELLTGSAQFATRAGKKNDPFLYQYLSLGHLLSFRCKIVRSFNCGRYRSELGQIMNQGAFCWALQC